VLLTILALALAGIAGVAAFLILTGSPPTPEEKQLVGQCVALNGEAVQVVPCPNPHDGRITSVVSHYGDCPSGASAFRLHPGTGNEHSGCYVSEIRGTQ
jgi:hypothetical protein